MSVIAGRVARIQRISVSTHLVFTFAVLDLTEELDENIADLAKHEKLSYGFISKIITRVMGVEPPNALGIDGFGDIDVLIFEDMLNGKDAAANRRITSRSRRRC